MEDRTTAPVWLQSDLWIDGDRLVGRIGSIRITKIIEPDRDAYSREFD